jgi:CspA family cold shock protein
MASAANGSAGPGISSGRATTAAPISGHALAIGDRHPTSYASVLDGQDVFGRVAPTPPIHLPDIVATDAPPARRAPDGLNNAEGTTMITGTVKWFDHARGYGFIKPENGSQDAFVHISAVERAGLAELREGQKVEYELKTGTNGKKSAEDLKLLD